MKLVADMPPVVIFFHFVALTAVFGGLIRAIIVRVLYFRERRRAFAHPQVASASDNEATSTDPGNLVHS